MKQMVNFLKKRKKHAHVSLLQFVGKLSPKEADEMLVAIQHNKYNKLK